MLTKITTFSFNKNTFENVVCKIWGHFPDINVLNANWNTGSWKNDNRNKRNERLCQNVSLRALDLDSQ